MGAFDVNEKVIRHKSWAKGENVTIREQTYGENMKTMRTCKGKDGEIDEMKLSEMLLSTSIVAWTFKKDGAVVPVNLDNIRLLPVSHITFIAQQIGALSPDLDEQFPETA